MSETTKPDCIYDLEGLASFLEWPHPNRYVLIFLTYERTLSSLLSVKYEQLLQRPDLNFLKKTIKRPVSTGTSINDVRRFWPIFDLPTYLRPIWSDFA